jgi:hypothetical protein
MDEWLTAFDCGFNVANNLKQGVFMKINTILAGLAAGALLLGLAGCQQSTSSSSSADLSGSAHWYFDVHQSGVIADAYVTTDKDGNVASASLKEWQNPNSWVTKTGSYANTKTGSTGSVTNYAGTEVFRMKMAGKNSTALDPAINGYVFFQAVVQVVAGTTAANPSVTTGWYELTPTITTTTTAGDTIKWTTPAANVVPNLDLKMAGLDYAKAYATDAAAVAGDNTKTDLANVTLTGYGTTTTYVASPASGSTVTVGSSAASTVTTGALVKTDPNSTYFPMSLTQLGYKTNYARLISTFTANPNADYGSASQLLVYTSKYVSGTSAAPTVVPTISQASYSLSIPTTTATATTTSSTADVQETATTASVWTITGGVDGLTGATFSDFPHYALGLQNAYLFARGEQGAVSRTIQ